MYFQSKVAERFSFLLNPAGIVIGYVCTLFAIVAGMVAFPFSKIWMALLFVVVGAFFVVAIPVIVMVHLSFMCAFFTALKSFAHWLCCRADRVADDRQIVPSSRKTWNSREPTLGFGFGGSIEFGERSN